MILRAKHEELFFVLVPICTETTEHRCSIIHRVSEHTELHVRIRNDAAVKEHEVWQRHGFTSFSAAPMATRKKFLFSLPHGQGRRPVEPRSGRPEDLQNPRTSRRNRTACRG